MREKYRTIDEYIAAFPPDIREILETIRQTIHTTVPDATEAIAYGIIHPNEPKAHSPPFSLSCPIPYLINIPHQTVSAPIMKDIIIKDARQHNLRNISVNISLDNIVVITSEFRLREPGDRGLGSCAGTPS